MARRRRPWLFGEPHIAKLGGLIYPFSIPARRTCPGKSRFCASICYADTGFFVMKNVHDKHVENLKRTREPSFVDDAVYEIKSRCITIARVHMAGDFYSAAYGWKWVNIVRQCHRTTFLCYTRSWTEDLIMPALVKLASMKNMFLWFSTDHEMPDAPAIPGVRFAYLLANDEDPSRVPANQHLVFRDKESVPLKRANGVLICPYEQGIRRQVKLTCSNCRVCFTPERKRHAQSSSQKEDHYADQVSPGQRSPRRRRSGR
jgi:hypothetical protein